MSDNWPWQSGRLPHYFLSKRPGSDKSFEISFDDMRQAGSRTEVWAWCGCAMDPGDGTICCTNSLALWLKLYKHSQSPIHRRGLSLLSLGVNKQNASHNTHSSPQPTSNTTQTPVRSILYSEQDGSTKDHSLHQLRLPLGPSSPNCCQGRFQYFQYHYSRTTANISRNLALTMKPSSSTSKPPVPPNILPSTLVDSFPP